MVCKCLLWSLQKPWKTLNQQRRPFQTPAKRRTFNGRPVKCKIINDWQTALYPDDEDSLLLCLSSLFWCGNDFLTFGGSFPKQPRTSAKDTNLELFSSSGPALLFCPSVSSHENPSSRDQNLLTRTHLYLWLLLMSVVLLWQFNWRYCCTDVKNWENPTKSASLSVQVSLNLRSKIVENGFMSVFKIKKCANDADGVRCSFSLSLSAGLVIICTADDVLTSFNQVCISD